ncbi:hypothetical protein JCM3765_005712 [Sporobolomyces pararoseus]
MTEVHSGGPTMGLELLTADQDSLALVAALLVEEIQAQTDAQLAEQLQLSIATDDTDTDIDRMDLENQEEQEEETEQSTENDQTSSMRQQLDFINSTISKSTIEPLVGSEREIVADHVRARQLDQLLEAKARKEQLDHEFARVLQKEDDEGRDLDEAAQQGLEAALGVRRVKELMTVPPRRFDPIPEGYEDMPIEAESSGNKGKAKLEDDQDDQDDDNDENVVIETSPAFPQCSICFEPVRVTSDPYAASLEANTFESLPYGMFVGLQDDNHVACVDCFGSYVENKLDDGTAKAFPIKCFAVACAYELTDEDAKRALGEENLKVWYHRQLVDSTPPLYCPNRACSERVIRHNAEDYDEPDAECPACDTWMCVEYLTCEQYQALPLDERSPEDLAMFEVARREGYTRCPGCQILMELTEGCFHMTCPCGTESCFSCGSRWLRARNERTGRCSKEPPCPLWDEQRLLRAEHREAARREARRQALAQAHAQVNIPQVNGQREERFLRRLETLQFLREPVGSKNAFTRGMRRRLRCGYCQAQFYNSQELQEHLASLSHSCFTCCNTLYKTAHALAQHIRSFRYNQNGAAHNPQRFVV